MTNATSTVEHPSDNRTLENRAKNRAFSDPYDALCILGFGFYLAWFYMILLGTGFDHTDLARTIAVNALYLFFGGEGIGALVVFLLSTHINSKESLVAVSVIAGAISMVPGIFILLPIDSLVIFIIVWLLGGIGAVLLASVWGFFLARLYHAQATLYPPLSMLTMVLVLFLTFTFSRPDVISLMIPICPFISIILFFIWASHIWSQSQFICPNKIHPPDWKSLSHSSVAMVANSFLIGFVAYAASSADSIASYELFFAAICAAAVFKIYDALHHQMYEVSSIIKVIAPTVAFCLLLLPFSNLYVRAALLIGMMFIAMIDEIVCWSAVAEYMRVHELMPFANIAYGRVGDTIGLLLGVFCSRHVFGLNMATAIPYKPLIAAIVILFIFTQTFYFQDNYTPFSEHKVMDANPENGDRPYAKKHPGLWVQRCTKFGDCYNLTPRQQQVLILLAKGYSTKTIQERLVVSNYTVKAHIYNIYKKTNVHTRQELIELLEQFSLDPRENSDDARPVAS